MWYWINQSLETIYKKDSGLEKGAGKKETYKSYEFDPIIQYNTKIYWLSPIKKKMDRENYLTPSRL